MEYVIIFFVIIFCVWLSTRIDTLEKKLSNQQFQLNKLRLSQSEIAQPTQTVSQEIQKPIVAVNFTAVSQPLTSQQTSQQISQTDIVLKWLAHDWLLKVGAVLLLLGLSWFVSFAFAENWIGPVGRIALGYGAGLLIIILGGYWDRRNSMQATVLLSLGVATMLVTTVSARLVYDFFTPLSALIIMFSSSAVLSISSVVRRDEVRAVVSLVFVSIVPFLTVPTASSTTNLLLYELIILTAVLWVVFLTRWHRLVLAGVGIHAAYSLYSVLSGNPSATFSVTALVFLISAFLFASTLLLYVKSKAPSDLLTVLTVLNPLVVLVWIHALAPENWVSLMVALVGLVCLWTSYFFHLASVRLRGVYEYLAVGLSLLGLAAVIEFEGSPLYVSLGLLVVFAMTAVYQLSRNILLTQKMGLLFAVVFLFVYGNWISIFLGFSRDIADYSFLYGWWFIVLELSLLGYYFLRLGQQRKDAEIEKNAAYFLLTALGFGLFTMWYSLEVLIPVADTAHVVALVIATIVGLCCYVYGKRNGMKLTQLAGTATLVVVTSRLIFVEIAGMDLIQRVIVFSIIGFLLIAAALIKPIEHR